MALIGNRSVLHKSPGRFLNGGVGIFRSAFNKQGMNLAAGFDAMSAIPNGHLAPSAWVLPRKSGGMSSVNFTLISLDSTGSAVGGITTTGSAELTFTVADANGQLISSGNGMATLSLTTNTPLLTASINGAGSASIEITVNTPTLGALADGTGEASLTVSATNSARLPADDSSPLRTGSSTLTITGTLTPYAIGQMAGTTEEAGLTPNGIAMAVWSRIIEAGFTAEEVIRILAAQAAGSATGLENGNPQFIGLDGVTLRIDGSYSAGTRTIDALNGD